jgi:hypothetical protein
MAWLIVLSTCPLNWAKTVTILKHNRTKQKYITQEEAKGKTDSQNMPNLPKSQNKTKKRKKKTK